MSRWDILGIGDTGVDIFLRVDRLPGRDEKVIAHLIGEFPGGMVANFCGAAGRLGATTALVSLVGGDPHGRAAIDDLVAHRVDVSRVAMRLGGRTCFCVVHLDESGEKALSVVVTGCIAPSIDQVKAVDLGHARLVYLAATELDLALWAAREAKKRGAIVMLDIESSAVLRDRPKLLRILGFVDIASANEAGFQALIGGPAMPDPAELLRFGPRVGIVTLGARGCASATTTQTARRDGFEVETVDTTGAGDCFNAAFAVSQLRGWTLQRGVEFATAAVAGAIAIAMEPDARLMDVIRAARRGAALGATAGLQHGRDVAGPTVVARLDRALELVVNASDFDHAIERLAGGVGTGLHISEAVPAALAIFLAADGDPFLTVVGGANAGDDTDTVACIAGSIAGAFKGIEAVPQDLYEQVEAANHLRLAERASTFTRIVLESARA